MTRIPDDSLSRPPTDHGPPPSLETVLDLPYLQPFTRRPHQLRRLVQVFVDSVESAPSRLAQAFERHDNRQVRELLHELHGTAKSVGAETLQSVCQRLLDLSPTDFGGQGALVVEEIATALQQTRAAFARFLDGLPPSPEPSSGRPPSPSTLLILDDSPTVRERLHQLLGDDYRLVEADSGRAALAACASEAPPDLLLVDINLGSSSGYQDDLSGLDVVRQLKGAIPFVVLTVDRSRETRRAAIKAGAWAYLVKPPEPDTLHAALETALARSRDAARAETQRVIHLATGILMAHHHLDEDEARRLLKTLASADRRTVQDVAEAIISTQRFQSRLAQMASQKLPTPPEGA